MEKALGCRFLQEQPRRTISDKAYDSDKLNRLSGIKTFGVSPSAGSITQPISWASRDWLAP
ncbi:MAG: hypothetical protein IIA14_11245 [SAR324 cluster bacterium]|nr:hypothetical protein [SAR324 cluster bacterium]